MLAFDAGSIMIAVVFVLIACSIIVIIVQGIRQWHHNNGQPKLAVEAKVVSKRMKLSTHQTGNGGDITGAHGFSTSTSILYFVTFQVESGDRMELRVSGIDYGMLAEGDHGKLRFQGTRYLGFDRT